MFTGIIAYMIAFLHHKKTGLRQSFKKYSIITFIISTALIPQDIIYLMI